MMGFHKALCCFLVAGFGYAVATFGPEHIHIRVHIPEQHHSSKEVILLEEHGGVGPSQFNFKEDSDSEDNGLDTGMDDINNICDSLCAILRVLYKQANALLANEPQHTKDYKPYYSTKSAYTVKSSDADLYHMPPDWSDDDFVDDLSEYEIPIKVKLIEITKTPYNELPDHKTYTVSKSDILNSSSRQDENIDLNKVLTGSDIILKMVKDTEDDKISEKTSTLVEVPKEEINSIIFATPKDIGESNSISAQVESPVNNADILGSSENSKICIITKIMRAVEDEENSVPKQMDRIPAATPLTSDDSGNDNPSPSNVHVKHDPIVQSVNTHKEENQPERKGFSDGDLIDALQYVMNDFVPGKTLAESYFQVMSKLIKKVGLLGLVRINELLAFADTIDYDEKPKLMRKICMGYKFLCVMGYYDGLNVIYTKVIY